MEAMEAELEPLRRGPVRWSSDIGRSLFTLESLIDDEELS